MDFEVLSTVTMESCLMGRDVVQFASWKMCRKSMLPPSSGFNKKETNSGQSPTLFNI
jgi:hypothetical protein